MIKNGLYDKAKVVPSPNKGGFIKPTAIIVHDTAGSLRKGSSVSWLTNPKARASAHFVIERDGTVTQLVSCNIKAWHAGKSELDGKPNVNNFAIGIEFVNPGALSEIGRNKAQAYYGEVFDRKKYKIEERGEIKYFYNEVLRTSHPPALWMPYTEAQIRAGVSLCSAIREVYPITRLEPHWYISPRRKIDTNPLFPLKWLQGRIQGRQDELDQSVRSDVVVRRWPSFYKTNVLPDFKPVKLGRVHTFPAEGENFPADLLLAELQWREVFDKDNNQAWILEEHKS